MVIDYDRFFFAPSASKRRTIRKSYSASAAGTAGCCDTLSGVTTSIFPFLFSTLTPPKTQSWTSVGPPLFGVSPVAQASLAKLFCVSQFFFLLYFYFTISCSLALTDLFASYFKPTICCATRMICTFQLEEKRLKMRINNHSSSLD